MIESAPPLVDYARIAREAVPVVGGCFDCDAAFAGYAARDAAHEHAKEKHHMVWLECKPHDL